MSVLALQEFVGRAIVSETFAGRVLNGRRAEMVREAGLEPEEMAEVMAINANTLAEFSQAMCDIIAARQGTPMPEWLEDLWNDPLPRIDRANR